MRKKILFFLFITLSAFSQAFASQHEGWDISFSYENCYIKLERPNEADEFIQIIPGDPVLLNIGYSGGTVTVSGDVTVHYQWRQDSVPFYPVVPAPEKVFLKEHGQISLQASGFYPVAHNAVCSIPGSISQSYNGEVGAAITTASISTFISEIHASGIHNFHIERDMGAGASFSKTRSFSGRISLGGMGEINIFIDYSPDIHATPYNFRVARELITNTPLGLGDVGGGQLKIPYVWNSTTGSNSDLSPNIHVYEVVMTSGYGYQNGDYWYARQPPYVEDWLTHGWEFINPRNGSDYPNDPGYWIPGSQGMLHDLHSKGGTLSIPPSGLGVGPFTITGQQNWMYNDYILGVNRRIHSFTGESGMNVITRSFFKLSETGPCGANCVVWRYRTTKHDFSAWQDLYFDPSDPELSTVPFRDSLGVY